MSERQKPTWVEGSPWIAVGQHALIRRAESSKLLIVKPDEKISFAKLTFTLTDALGQPFDSYFEVDLQGRLRRLEDLTDVLAIEADPTADNRDLTDDIQHQTLTSDEITAMKQQGVSGQELIDKIVEGSTTFKTKTEFSQAKYIKKKQLKHFRYIQIVRPTPRTLCEALFDSQPQRIAHLRPDSLAQLLTHANICAGSNVLVIDDSSGLLTGAVAQRLAGRGTILHLHPGRQPSLSLLDAIGLSQAERSVIRYLSLSFVIPESNISAVFRDNQKAAAELFSSTQFDSLVMASRFHPESLLLALLKKLAKSRSFAVHSPFIEPLSESFQKIRQRALAVNVELFEAWFRQHQVLPNRTHPLMTMSATGGYLLTGISIA